MTHALKATLALAAAALVLAPAASAADGDLPAAPSGVTTNAVDVADQAAKGSLGAAFSDNAAKQTGQTLAKGKTKRTGEPVNVYMLSPQFVKDGSGPVGQFAYAATSYDVNGVAATVYSASTPGGWQGVNIATGTTEQSLATKGRTSSVLLEPQVHAYYAVKGNSLHALNASAEKAIGGTTISRTAYAKLVHDRYASMLPGSSYDKQGAAGGFSQTATPAKDDHTAGIAASSVGGAAIVLGGATIVHRRRKNA